MKIIQLLVFAALCTLAGTATSAMIRYSVYGLIDRTDIVDDSGSTILGRTVRIRFEYDDSLTTQRYLPRDEVTTAFNVTVSVAGLEASINSTSTYFDSYNDVYDLHSCYDNFLATGNGFYALFEDSTPGPMYNDNCNDADTVPTILESDQQTAPTGSFVYRSGGISIADFGQMSFDYIPQPVPAPAAIWLFGSGLVAISGINLFRKKKDLE